MNYDRGWLSSAVVRAAESAGYKKWWLTSHVTESVSSFLQQEFDGNVVTISRLEKAVRSVLNVIGYADVADCFQTLPPPVRVSLYDMARRAGTGYELVFFGLLRERLAEILESAAQQVEFSALHAGVKQLKNAKHWNRDCSRLTDEIVVFIRAEIAAANRSGQLQFQLT